MYSLRLFLASALLAAACSDSRPPAGAGGKTNVVRQFYVRGVVRELRLADKMVVIQHDAIPQYMEAMQMPFNVRHTNDVSGIGLDDEVHFRFLVSATESWIDQVTRTGRKLGTNETVRPPLRAVREVEILKVGDLLPDYPLTNQLGEAFTLGQFRGRALAFTFFFTICPVPDFCPKMSRHFVEVQRMLKERPDAPTNWQLLSITFDVDRDTPAVLKAHAKGLGHDPARWMFATGKLIEIDALTEQFGLVFPRDGAVFNHNLRTVVVDAAGRVQTIFIGNTWKPADLVAEMVKAARVTPKL
ncbi:MAG: hypothetical protein EXS24_05820 [Pedosphaera sp.]|nr:hypothetical protein [Pedosphaera sp.]